MNRREGYAKSSTSESEPQQQEWLALAQPTSRTRDQPAAQGTWQHQRRTELWDVCRRSEGWVRWRHTSVQPEGVCACLTVTVKPCERDPKLRVRTFRTFMIWSGKPGEEMVRFYDEEGDVRAAWEKAIAQGKEGASIHLYRNEILCLGLDVEVRSLLEGTIRIEETFKKGLLPYLCDAAKAGEGRWEEGSDRPHDVWEGYKEWIGEQTGSGADGSARLLELWIDEDESADECPCGSGLEYEKCHEIVISVLQERYPNRRELQDLYSVLKARTG